jgi:hypothetical protein
VKTVPSATTLTLSATEGGSTFDVQSDITGPTFLAKAGYRCQSGVWVLVDPSQYQSRYTFKNSFELKNAVNVVLDGNVLENTWIDAQPGGWGIAQVDNFNPWSTVRNITFRNNISSNQSAGFGASSDGVQPPFPNKVGQIVYSNNLWHSPNGSYWVGVIQTIYGGIFDHNTWVVGRFAHRFEGQSQNLRFTNSVFVGVGGFTSEIGNGCTAIPSRVIGLTIANNMFWGEPQDWGWPGTYNCGSGNVWISGAPNLLEFMNADNGNFRLVSGSNGIRAANDAMDIGANIDEVEEITGGVVSGSPDWGIQANLHVDSVNSAMAVLSYQSPISSACTVELSTAPSFWPLHADTATAASQTDARAGNVVDGPFRQFVLGRNQPLTPSTKYFFRVTCGNRVMTGQFRTTASKSGGISVPLSLGAQVGTANAKAYVEYGPTTSLGSRTAEIDCVSGCRMDLSAVRQTLTYWRYMYLNSSGQVQAAGQLNALAVP